MLTVLDNAGNLPRANERDRDNTDNNGTRLYSPGPSLGAFPFLLLVGLGIVLLFLVMTMVCTEIRESVQEGFYVWEVYGGHTM